MTTKLLKQIIYFFSISIGFLSCIPGHKKYDLNYPKYYDKYSFQQLGDTLYSDTLLVGPDPEGGFSQRIWYTEKIAELLSDLKSDWQKPDSLFPLTKFDKIKITKSPWEFAQTLTNDQANRLLEIITDPAVFDWSETTYETEFVFEFELDGEVINSLELNGDRSVFMPSPHWPTFKKMKFGHLKDHAQQDLNILIDELMK